MRILEAVQQQDVNLIIALILSRQLGWPIDFIHDDSSMTFVLIVPHQPFGHAKSNAIEQPSYDTADMLRPKQMY